MRSVTIVVIREFGQHSSQMRFIDHDQGRQVAPQGRHAGAQQQLPGVATELELPMAFEVRHDGGHKGLEPIGTHVAGGLPHHFEGVAEDAGGPNRSDV